VGGFVIVAAMVGIGVGFSFRPKSPLGQATSTPEPDLDISLSERCRNFGEVWENTHFKWVLAIENRMNEEINIKRFVSSCTCIAVRPQSLTISPGQIKEVQITIDLSEKGSKKAESQFQIRDFAVNIQPVVENAGREIVLKAWEIKGTVRRLLGFNKPAVNFGRQFDRSQPIGRQVVVVTTCAPLTDFTFECTSGPFRVNARPNGKGRDARYEIEVCQRPEVPVGFYRSEIVATAHLPGGLAVKSPTLPVLLEVVPDISATPAQVHFGAKKKGETCAEAILLSSLTETPFEITDFAVNITDGIKSKPRVEKSPTGCFLISQTISGLGRQKAEIVFSIRADGGKCSKVAVPVEYHGLPSE
jgi:hypothetical protein